MGIRAPGVAEFFRDFADPVLAAHGFRGRRRIYRHRAGNGDVALVQFADSRPRMRGAWTFVVWFTVVPAAWLDWITHGATDVEPEARHGLFAARLPAPASAWNMFGRWVIDSADAGQARGRELVQLLEPQLRTMVSLLDRAEFLRRLRADPPIPLPQSPVVMEVVMLVDDGPSAELDDALARMSLKGAGPAFVEWARQRAASR